MANIYLNVIGHDIECTNDEKPVLAQGSHNFDKVYFTHDASWDGYNLSATMYQSVNRPVVVDLDSNGCAGIPLNVLYTPGKVFIGLRAEDEAGNLIITSGLICFDVRPGAIDGDEPAIVSEVVDGQKLLDGSVTSNKIAAGAVTHDKMALNAVSKANIMDDAVGYQKLDAGLKSMLQSISDNLDLKFDSATLINGNINFYSNGTFMQMIGPVASGVGFSYCFYDTSTYYLHFYDDNGIDVVDPVYVPGGGGSGGGGGGNAAVLTVTNTTGWLSKTISEESSCQLSFSWSSLEDSMPTGNGTMKLFINGVQKATWDIVQGNVTRDIKAYLGSGVNTAKVTISDVYANSRTITFTITVVSLSISSSFDSSVPYSGSFTFPYTPVGAVSKNVYFYLDGSLYDTVITPASGRQLNYVFPAQASGRHTLRVYFDADIDGNTVQSNELYYEIICVADGDTNPIITSSFNAASITQYESVVIPYFVYNPASMYADITLLANGQVISTLTVDRTEQRWTYRAEDTGTLTLAIRCGSVTKSWTLTVTASDVDVEAETENLALHLSSYGRSNNEGNPAFWKYGNISASFSGFNWTSDGWQHDEDGNTVLRVSGDARLTIPYKMFQNDFRSTGKTIEFEFATRDVRNYDTAVVSCMSGGRGFTLTAQAATLASEQSSIYTQYKENEHVRIAFVVEKRTENRLIYVYINGICSGTVQYPTDDDFSQASPVNISIGSSDCTTDIYCIRVYDNDLTRYQILDNWIADTQNITDLLDRYTRNNVFDQYSQIVISKLPTDLPYMILSCAELPQFKGDKKTVSGSYTDPNDSSRSFTFTGAQADVQGTSSQYYARKNYKIKFKGGFNVNGTQSSDYAMNADAIPTDTFTFKADVASSEGANNVELARLYNNICPYRTVPQQSNAKVRQGIDGFPIVIFWENTATGDVTFIGKYNFNNDKGTEEVFGFSAGDESWEIKNNTSSRVLWKSADYSGADWLNDFEGRYPEDNTDGTNLAVLAAWLVSTDQEAVSGASAKAARLQKFINEIDDHMERQAVEFYYLFTELFLMVDSRAKNAFPSIIGGSKWFSLPYDFDTAIGINNEGALAFSYNLEDIDQTSGGADVFNGQQSVLWINLRQGFFDEIKAMYQSLRSSGVLSYAVVEQMFEAHQSKWPEAIFNEDAYFKYLQPLIDDGSAAYLTMLQGSKAEQRKWWLYNRFRYMDSKYNAGDALTDVITVRGYAKSNITVTPYADVYASVKYGSYLVQTRAARNQSYTLVCPLDNVNDTEIYIYSASQLASVGDLSGLMVGYAEFSMGTKLQSLKIGDSSSSYSNGNLTELYLGNNTLLQTLDVRNCPNLTQAVDISGCVNIENVYFDGTAITGLTLPNGGVLRKLHLPGTVTNLTVRNQTRITEFVMPDFSNITTLRLENVPSVIDEAAILREIDANSRVRLIGFHWDLDSEDEIDELYDILDTMRGLDENGNNTAHAQLAGTIHVPSGSQSVFDAFRERYPDVIITADTYYVQVFYYSYNGSELIFTEILNPGESAEYARPYPRTSDGMYDYHFLGWNVEKNQYSVTEGCQDTVTEDRTLYAAYSRSLRQFPVYFYNNEGTLLQTVENITYGSSASYTGSTPQAETNPTWYTFTGWSPQPTNITGPTSCYAQYEFTLLEESITDSWSDILANINNGQYVARYHVGDTKLLNLGSEGYVLMQVAGLDMDDLAVGTGKAAITWISQQLLVTSRRWNPALVTNYAYKDVAGWKLQSGQTYRSQNVYNVETARATWTVTATTAGTLSVKYKTSNGAATNSISITVNGTSVASGYHSTTQATHTVSCAAGDTVTVVAEYAQTSASLNYYGEIAFSSTGTISVSMNAETCSTGYIDSYQEGTGTIGGWDASELGAYYNTTLYNLIPEEVRAGIKTVIKCHPAYDTDGQSFTQTSWLDVWAPSQTEIFGSASSTGQPFYSELFPDQASRVKYKTGASSAASWWLRTPAASGYLRHISNVGSMGTYGAGSDDCLALGFCF